MTSKTGVLSIAHHLVALAATFACACSDPPEGTPSGAICPPGNTISYENFGRDFMTRYCTDCHASTLRGADRQGAPPDHDFDTRNSVIQNADHIDEYAAAGPLAVNVLMPERAPKPTLAERQQLGVWLACELNPPAPDAGVDAP